MLFGFILFPGPCGALLYRVAAFLADFWERRNDAEAGRCGAFPHIAGDHRFSNGLRVRRKRGLELSWQAERARSGFVLVRPAQVGDEADEPVEVFPGKDVDADSMQSAAGLIWHAVVLCLLLLMFVRFAHLAGV